MHVLPVDVETTLWSLVAMVHHTFHGCLGHLAPILCGAQVIHGSLDEGMTPLFVSKKDSQETRRSGPHRVPQDVQQQAECPQFVHPRCNIQPEPVTVRMTIPAKVPVHVVIKTEWRPGHLGSHPAAVSRQLVGDALYPCQPGVPSLLQPEGMLIERKNDTSSSWETADKSASIHQQIGLVSLGVW